MSRNRNIYEFREHELLRIIPKKRERNLSSKSHSGIYLVLSRDSSLIFAKRAYVAQIQPILHFLPF